MEEIKKKILTEFNCLANHFPSIKRSQTLILTLPVNSWHCHLGICLCPEGRKNALMEYPGHLDNSGNQLTSFFGQIMLLNLGLTNPAHSIAPQSYTVGARCDKCFKFIWIHQTMSPLLHSLFFMLPTKLNPLVQ